MGQPASGTLMRLSAPECAYSIPTACMNGLTDSTHDPLN